MIYLLPILIGAAGMVLLAVLSIRILEVNKALKLQRHRARDAGLADLLNYAAVVDDGVIVGVGMGRQQHQQRQGAEHDLPAFILRPFLLRPT